MPSVSDASRIRNPFRRKRPTAVALWSLLVALILGGMSDMVVSVIAGASPWQYVYLLRQKRRVRMPSSYTPLTWAAFLQLPELPKAYGAADWRTVRAYSRRGVSLEGYVAEILRMHDGDLHVNLRSTPPPHCFPKGQREEQIVTEVTPDFQPPTTGWSYAALRDLCERQSKVRVGGWLMHDFPHTGNHTWRVTMWEIHPVTRLEVWDDDYHAWRSIP